MFANGQDPVALGLVESINRPSGNLTGVTFMASELGLKRLGLLYQNLDREGEEAGVAGWTNALNTNAMSCGQVLAAFFGVQ